MGKSNSTLELLCHHRSIRAYKDKPISEKYRDEILRAAQTVSSSNFLQAASIIRITDISLRKILAKLAGDQPYVVSAAEFWIFVADFNRNKQIDPSLNVENPENLLVGTIDAALMAQNAVIAAESLGLGCVYIGGIRNEIDEVTRVLTIPKHVIPLFGIAIGYPDQDPEIKPRLPKQLMFFENHYGSINKEWVKEYDKTMCRYYAKRSSNQRTENWSTSLASGFNPKRAEKMLPYLRKQGWIGK